MKKTFFVILVALLLLFLPACGVSADSDTTGIFSDVPSDAWYVQGVNYCTEQGILNGTSETTFSPNDAMTRSMLAVVFYRLAGSPDVSVSSYFNDAIVGNWYSDAISWAVDSGIISGYGDGRFGVNDAVTREQMAAILWRYAGAPDTNSGESFADASTIATWALPAVNWARESGIMKGREHNNFCPSARRNQS